MYGESLFFLNLMGEDYNNANKTLGYLLVAYDDLRL